MVIVFQTLENGTGSAGSGGKSPESEGDSFEDAEDGNTEVKVMSDTVTVSDKTAEEEPFYDVEEKDEETKD